ncbi:flavoprotein [Secundilactobacillus paracollinoides]|uniref:Urocanate reductase n=1 Tax=Secundilactobacillus paracollinoides TaxID=240427 RepID=A0A1B2J0Z1_9LACO|nr:FAD-dependent oxidoreductase [Secundilactobacillus paracollinoides]ANZ62061.1 flavoprotein [Secundilactobacillus paracollinoides]ANZ63745.1 flavoprotein [Secundilactobacillus paracollinoides]ANZ68006.1 flavoprotein [Secundilactobacillus paracollinoides]
MSKQYQGTAKGFHGNITATVTIEDDKITAVTAEVEPGTVGALGVARLADAISATGNPDVDAITGATVSSYGFEAAVHKATAVAKGDLTADQALDAATEDPYKLADVTTGASENVNVVERNPSPVTKPVPYNSDVHFDETYDVVVVGAGGAGLSAATEAAQAGLSVFISEKAGIPGGTTNFSGGVMQAAGTSYQKDLTDYDSDNPDKHASYWIDAGEDQVDMTLVRDLAKNAPKNIDWLADMGIKWQSVYGNTHIPATSSLDFADRIHVYDNGKGGGIVLTQTLLKAALDAGATISYDTPTTALIQDRDRKIVYGVVVSQNGEKKVIAAKRGVILATAGIDHNLELAKALNPQHYSDLQHKANLSAVTDTGDGIFLGMAAGAGINGMGGTIDLDGKTGNATNDQVPSMPMIYVNAKGKRFVCEDATYAFTMRAVFQQEKQLGKPTYMIFDDNSITAEGSAWTAESLAKDLASGEVKKADSIADLAKLIHAPETNLYATLKEWNANVANGGDPVYDRQTGIAPLDAPFYVHQTKAMNLGAIGGLTINVEGQVLDVLDAPIKGLYAAGLTAGGWLGPYYPGSGTAIAGIVHQGRKAAQTLIKKHV